MTELAYAYGDAQAEIAAFMDTSFHRAKWDSSRWRALLDGRWTDPDAPIAVTARDAGRLIGVIGMLPVRRSSGHLINNLTSWYLDAGYRGQSLGRRMMEMSCWVDEAAVTNLSSARAAMPVAKAAGLEVLDDTRLIWHPRPDTLDARIVATQDLREVRDHADLNVTPVTVETPDGPVTLILSIKQKDDTRVMHEALWMSDRAAFATHAPAIAAALLPGPGTVLAVDQRFAPDATADAVEAIAMPRFWRPGDVPRGAVDMLYSEIVLLDMKLY